MLTIYRIDGAADYFFCVESCRPAPIQPIVPNGGYLLCKPTEACHPL